MQYNNVMEPERLSESRILQIRSKATGSSVHTVRNLIGAYQIAIKLMDEDPSDGRWRRMAQRNAVKLQIFFRTGLVECLSNSPDNERQCAKLCETDCS